MENVKIALQLLKLKPDHWALSEQNRNEIARVNYEPIDHRLEFKGSLDNDEIQMEIRSSGRRPGVTISLKERLLHGEDSGRLLVEFYCHSGDILDWRETTSPFDSQREHRTFVFDHLQSESAHWRRTQAHQPVHTNGKHAWVWPLSQQMLKDMRLTIQVRYDSSQHPLLNAFRDKCDYHLYHGNKENFPAPWDDAVPTRGFGPPGSRLQDLDSLQLPQGIPDEIVTYNFADNTDYELTQTRCLAYQIQASHRAQQSLKEEISACSWSLTLRDHSTASICAVQKFTILPPKSSLRIRFGDLDFGEWTASCAGMDGDVAANQILNVKQVEPGKKYPKFDYSYYVGLDPISVVPFRVEREAVRAFSQAQLLASRKHGIPWDLMKKGLQHIDQGIALDQIKPKDHIEKGLHQRVKSVLLEELNGRQKLAFNTVIKPPNKVTLTVGPPGTGKTKLIVDAVVYLALNGYSVLLCGSSNDQLDAVTLDIDRKQKSLKDANPDFPMSEIVRVYPSYQEDLIMQNSGFPDANQHGEEYAVAEGSDKSPPRVLVPKSFSWTTLGFQALERSDKVKDRELLQKWRNFVPLREEENDYLNEAFSTAEASIIKNAKIFVSTCHASSSLKLNGKVFDILIIDECAQLMEANALIPVIKFPRVQALWAVGDNAQLSAVIKFKCPLSGQLRTSLFERLMRLGFVTTRLETQYRMRDELLKFTNQEFYDNSLESAYQPTEVSRAWDKFCTVNNYPLGLAAIYTKDTEASQNVVKSWTNPKQVEHVINFIHRIRESPQSQTIQEITILTLYTGQVDIYRQVLRKESAKYPELAKIQVFTVDSFQGRQTGIGIFDLVRTAKGLSIYESSQINVGFAKENARILVAMSRSQHGLVVFADRDFMTRLSQNSGPLRKLAAYFHAKKMIRPPHKYTLLRPVKSPANSKKRTAQDEQQQPPKKSKHNSESVTDMDDFFDLESGSEEGEIVEKRT